MAKRRRQPPLFEVLRAGDAKPGKPGWWERGSDEGAEERSGPVAGGPADRPPPEVRRPVAPVEPKPSFEPARNGSGAAHAPVPAASPAAHPANVAPAGPGAPRAATGSAGSRWGASGGRSVRVPAAGVVAAGVAMVLVLLGVWTLAYREGQRAERQRLVSQPPPTTTDPLVNDPARDLRGRELAGGGAPQGGDSARLDPERRDEPVVTDPDKDETPPRIDDQSGSEGGSSGGSDGQIVSELAWTLGVDPRQPGWNYLLVVRLPGESAFQAADYLTRNGLPSAALPVDPDVDPVDALAKNLDHHVVVLDGVPPGQFRSRGDWRRTLQNRVAELGRKYRAEDSLRDDFALQKHQWARYDG